MCARRKTQTEGVPLSLSLSPLYGSFSSLKGFRARVRACVRSAIRADSSLVRWLSVNETKARTHRKDRRTDDVMTAAMCKALLFC